VAQRQSTKNSLLYDLSTHDIMCKTPGICIMKIFSDPDGYTQQLEQLVINKLLPAYVERCRYLGVPVDYSDVPTHILSETVYAKNVAALLRPKKGS
jgi:hypothetical protein